MSEQRDVEARLAEIEAYCQAATEGPWENAYHVTNHKWSGIFADASETGYAASVREPSHEQAYVDWQPGNEEFVIRARTDLPALLAVARAAADEHSAIKNYIQALFRQQGDSNVNTEAAFEVAAEVLLEFVGKMHRALAALGGQGQEVEK